MQLPLASQLSPHLTIKIVALQVIVSTSMLSFITIVFRFRFAFQVDMRERAGLYICLNLPEMYPLYY